MHGRGGESARGESPGKERLLVLLAPPNNNGYTPLNTIVRRDPSKIRQVIAGYCMLLGGKCGLMLLCYLYFTMVGNIEEGQK